MSIPYSYRYYMQKIVGLMDTINNMPFAALEEIDNGCGPSSPLFGIDVIPDNLAGINIKPACGRHDVGYHLGENDEEKTISDLMFMNVMVLLIIYSDKSDIEKAVALNLAMKYFAAVYFKGEDAFYAGKSDDDIEGDK